MAGKGVSPQPNPMELPEAEAKAVFDQLVKEVVVPFFNKFVEAFANVDLTSDADKPTSMTTAKKIWHWLPVTDIPTTTNRFWTNSRRIL